MYRIEVRRSGHTFRVIFDGENATIYRDGGPAGVARWDQRVHALHGGPLLVPGDALASREVYGAIDEAILTGSVTARLRRVPARAVS